MVDNRFVIEREGRTIVLEWMGRGNTDGDLLVWLPDDGILITGDVLVGPVPYAFDAPMVDWITTLDRVAELGARTIVPGHGRVQHDTAYLEQVRALLEGTVAAVRDAHAAGVAYADLAAAVDLSAYESRFTGGDPVRRYAWRSFYLTPGLRSAWASLGYPVPDDS
jgi:glyoxylase-like metal-dependent hydrolase (beta-lactamase superfamily II)